MEKVLLIADHRAGTHFFNYVMSNHPQIHSCDEILHTDWELQDNFYNFWRQKIIKNRDSLNLYELPALFDEYLSTTLTKVPEYNRLALADVKYQSLNLINNQLNIMKKHFTKVIHLVRKNILKQYLSFMLLTNRQVAERTGKSLENVSNGKVRIGIDHRILNELHRKYSNILMHRNIYSGHFDYLEIYYEDFFKTENKTSESNTIRKDVLDKIYEFVNIKETNHSISTTWRKDNSNNLRDLIENYSETKAFLTTHGWGYLFDDINLQIPSGVNQLRIIGSEIKCLLFNKDVTIGAIMKIIRGYSIVQLIKIIKKQVLYIKP